MFEMGHHRRLYAAYPLSRSSKWVEFLDVGGAQEGLDILATDDDLLVASESRRAPAGREGGVVKYRLLVRPSP